MTDDDKRDIDRHVRQLKAQRAVDDATLRLATGMDGGSTDLHVHEHPPHAAACESNDIERTLDNVDMNAAYGETDQDDDGGVDWSAYRRHTLNCDINSRVGGHHKHCSCWCHDASDYERLQRLRQATAAVNVGVAQGGGPAYLDATDVCEFCAHGEHEIGLRVGESCGCRCHGGLS